VARPDEPVGVVLRQVVGEFELEDGRTVDLNHTRTVIGNDRVVVDGQVSRGVDDAYKVAVAAPVLAVDVPEDIVLKVT